MENITGETLVNLSGVEISATTAKIDVVTGKVEVSLTNIDYSTDQNKWHITALLTLYCFRISWIC